MRYYFARGSIAFPEPNPHPGNDEASLSLNGTLILQILQILQILLHPANLANPINPASLANPVHLVNLANPAPVLQDEASLPLNGTLILQILQVLQILLLLGLDKKVVI